jgi:hypothetical protein
MPRLRKASPDAPCIFRRRRTNHAPSPSAINSFRHNVRLAVAAVCLGYGPNARPCPEFHEHGNAASTRYICISSLCAVGFFFTAFLSLCFLLIRSLLRSITTISYLIASRGAKVLGLGKMATAGKTVTAESTKEIPPAPTAQQSDNVAHALAGAGGGILSTALTSVSALQVTVFLAHSLTVTPL